MKPLHCLKQFCNILLPNCSRQTSYVNTYVYLGGDKIIIIILLLGIWFKYITFLFEKKKNVMPMLKLNKNIHFWKEKKESHLPLLINMLFYVQKKEVHFLLSIHEVLCSSYEVSMAVQWDNLSIFLDYDWILSKNRSYCSLWNFLCLRR